MRRTYEVERFDFTNLPGHEHGDPQRVVVHRQGNPGARARASLAWGNEFKTYSIHSYVEDTVCIDAVPPERHAYHVREHRKAAEFGCPTRHVGWRRVWGPRGDIRAIGVETVELAGPGAPGVDQAYHLTQETRITLLLRVADYLRQFPSIEPLAQVHSHAELDPWTRLHDPGDALNIDDFRDDLRDLLDGREPWRTVGPVATAQRASDEGERAVSSASRIEVLLEAIESDAREARSLLGTGLDER